MVRQSNGGDRLIIVQYIYRSDTMAKPLGTMNIKQ
jgi:hypothetical protein